jgi:Family of unknown function (DUF6496)
MVGLWASAARSLLVMTLPEWRRFVMTNVLIRGGVPVADQKETGWNRAARRRVFFGNTFGEMRMSSTAQKRKVSKVMHEYKEGDLKSGSGSKVKSRKQAVAIAMSESGQSKRRKKAS